MKSLNTIQTLAKIGRVLSKIVFVFCIVGAILSAVGGVCYAVFGEKIFESGAVTIQGLIDADGAPSAVVYYAVAVGFLACVLEAILSKKAERYFVHELADGTPFTMRGAHELKNVGVLAIVFPAVLAIINGIGSGIIDHMLTEDMEETFSFHFELSGIGLGIGLVIVAVLCRYGASLLQAPGEQAPEISV